MPNFSNAKQIEDLIFLPSFPLGDIPKQINYINNNYVDKFTKGASSHKIILVTYLLLFIPPF